MDLIQQKKLLKMFCTNLCLKTSNIRLTDSLEVACSLIMNCLYLLHISYKKGNNYWMQHFYILCSNKTQNLYYYPRRNRTGISYHYFHPKHFCFNLKKLSYLLLQQQYHLSMHITNISTNQINAADYMKIPTKQYSNDENPSTSWLSHNLEQ